MDQSSQSSSQPSSSSNPFSPKYEEEPMDQGESDEEQPEDVEQEKEAIPRALTESYTEITLLRKFCENPNQDLDDDDVEGAVGGSDHPRRPDSLECEANWEKGFGSGIVARDGQFTHFVADNLEQKIKLASPNTKKEVPSTSASKMSTPSYIPKNFLLPPHLQPVDPNVLNDIELEAQYLAASIDNLTENLCNLLHSISSITADNVDCYKNAVNKLTDCMDANIKHMYTIMAKTEEISKAMKPVEQLAQRIKDLRKLVDVLESNL